MEVKLPSLSISDENVGGHAGTEQHLDSLMADAMIDDSADKITVRKSDRNAFNYIVTLV